MNTTFTNGKIEYKVEELLGKGAKSKCYLITDIKTGNKYAAKIINNRGVILSPTEEITEKILNKQRFVCNEITIHSGLTHPNVVDFIDLFETDDSIVMVLELCVNKSLYDMSRTKIKKKFKEDEIKHYLSQMLDGLGYIHNKRIIHRDIKLGNIFVDENMNVKIGDFGMAVYLDDDDDAVCGTPNYISPEVLSNISRKSKPNHSFKSDIWALGVILYTMAVGKPPFETNSIRVTYDKIKRVDYCFPNNSSVSSDLKDLIESILQKTPSKRPSIEDIRKHKFLLNITNKKRSNFIDKIYESLDSFLNGTNKNYNINYKQKTYITQWHHYKKYGLGYSLNNKEFGMYFNDETIMITQLDKNVKYIGKNNADKKIYKKTGILNRYINSLDNNNNNNHNNKQIYVKKWIKTDRCYMFRLSNDTIQTEFNDGTGIILSENTATPINTDEGLFVKLGYIRDVLENMISKN